MKRVSIYFVDGKSLSLTMEDVEYEAFALWLKDEEVMKPYVTIQNQLEYFIFKSALEYIIA